jgi:hypothetical protein
MIFNRCKRKMKQMEYDIHFTGKQIKKWQFWVVLGYAIKMQLWLELMLLTADLKPSVL